MTDSIFGGGGQPQANPVYDPFAGQRGQYATMLSNLYNNPGTVTSQPGYEFNLNQGTQALNRTYAATGQQGSGGQAIGLQNYGQGYAANYLNTMSSNLAQLSGATTGPMSQGVNNYSAQNSQQGLQNAMGLAGAGYGLYSSGALGYAALGEAGTGAGIIGAVSSLFSDRKLKKHIKLIGKFKNGLNKYTWTYLWGQTATGAMADEVEKLIPEAVSEFKGYKVVNYALLGE